MVWLKLIFFLFFSLNLFSQELTSEELAYFNFFDFNNDGYISQDEINQSITIVLKLLDNNQDEKISIEEVKNLKEIITSF